MLMGLVCGACTLALGVAAAAAAEVVLPGSPAPSLPPAAPPTGAAPPAPAPAVQPGLPTAPAVTTTTFALGQRVLKVGMFGSDVKDLQRELRRRGQRLAVDGSFGPATRKAVRTLQKRFKLRLTGVVDRTLLRKLGVQVRSVASGPGAAAPPVAAKAPAPGAAPVSNGAVGQYLKAFPVAGKHTYYDDFGEPRGQGPHQGNDIMAARGTPVVAVADGAIDRVSRAETGLGGITLYLRDTAGNVYFYAHLNEILIGIEAGTKVSVGQQIATVGNTGDARYGATHLHFELHPGGGAPVSPFQELVTVDPTPPAAKR
jgi:murein DD-endopeptidase MepM/ murein hydrolase activator NlpD